MNAQHPTPLNEMPSPRNELKSTLRPAPFLVPDPPRPPMPKPEDERDSTD